MAYERVARSVNPAALHGLFKELLDRSSKRQDQQKSLFSFALLVNRTVLA